VDNIYVATPICGVNGLVVVKNAKTGDLLEGATVSAMDAKNVLAATQSTTEMGTTNFGLNCEMTYNLQATKSGFENAIATMQESEGGEMLQLRF
jgi:hypothetical protein